MAQVMDIISIVVIVCVVVVSGLGVCYLLGEALGWLLEFVGSWFLGRDDPRAQAIGGLVLFIASVVAASVWWAMDRGLLW